MSILPKGGTVFFRDKLPLTPYAKDTEITNSANQMTAELVNTNLVDAGSQGAKAAAVRAHIKRAVEAALLEITDHQIRQICIDAVSYTHLRAHETRGNLVCRLLLEKKKK